MTDHLATKEREKYERVWADDRYRRISPGMMEVHRAFDHMGCRPGETINDYGCGAGLACAWFERHGLTATGIDHAENARTEDILFLGECLWDMSFTPESDYAFCCDVLEHIPPEKVDDVVRGIAERTHKAAWFRIATRPDAMGPLIIGEPLHLTVRPAQWWQDTLGEFWGTVQPIQADLRDGVFLCTPKPRRRAELV